MADKSLDLDVLLQLLKEDKVRQAILDIVQPEEGRQKLEEEPMLKQLKEKYEKLKKCLLEEKENTINFSKSVQNNKEALSTLRAELEDVSSRKKQAEDEYISLSKQYTYLNEAFKDVLVTHKLYHSLSDVRKVALKGIFKEDSLKGVWACGLQEKNIIGFWEYIRGEIIEGNTDELSKLVIIFEFFFESYLLAYPVYERQSISGNELFSSDKHINHPDSVSPHGKIKSIELTGWQNAKTGKVIKRSVVIL